MTRFKMLQGISCLRLLLELMYIESNYIQCIQQWFGWLRDGIMMLQFLSFHFCKWCCVQAHALYLPQTSSSKILFLQMTLLLSFMLLPFLLLCILHIFKVQCFVCVKNYMQHNVCVVSQWILPFHCFFSNNMSFVWIS